MELFRRYYTDRTKTFIATLIAISATFIAVSLIVSQLLGILCPTLVFLTFVFMLLYMDHKNVPKRLFLLPLFVFISLYFYCFGSNNAMSYNVSKAFVILTGGMLAAFTLTKPTIRTPGHGECSGFEYLRPCFAGPIYQNAFSPGRAADGFERAP